MFVSKRQCDAMEKDYINRVKTLCIDLDNKRIAISKLEDEIDNLLKTNQEMIKTNNVLAEENKKLIEWIEKIIHEAGCYEVNDREPVRIPICTNDRAYEPIGEPIVGKEIRIPEIRFLTYSHRR